jgi:ubiquitin-conjugating enzyme E2 J2
MATDICTKRLTKELKALAKEPLTSPKITVRPKESNILEMHFVIEGSEGTPYSGGIYHGKLLFPKEYPLKPPGVMMCTPNGRFRPHCRLCMTMSGEFIEKNLENSGLLICYDLMTFSGIVLLRDYVKIDFHPETWNPLWSVGTIITGLYSFMIESGQTVGSIETTVDQKRKFARQSLEYNVRDPMFAKLFPEYVKLQKERLATRQDALGIPSSDPSLEGSSSLTVPEILGRNEQVDINGLVALGAGIFALLAIAFSMMRFL